MKIAIITAGGAGMFCGSCMQDNTLARTLTMAGHDAVLVPTYTPIRVDEENASSEKVFMGGINVYLDSVVPGWKYLPGWITGLLDRPAVLRSLSRCGGSTDASKLGSLTLDMLKGDHGPQRREFHEFADFLCDELNPDTIVFSNALISGVMPELRQRFSGRILCLLQGDDIFLEALSDDWKSKVLEQLRENAKLFDGFLTHSEYYRQFMAEYLAINSGRIRTIPLTLDTAGVEQHASVEKNAPTRIGYFARICPEKGVQNLLSAATETLSDFPNAQITIAGYLPEQHRSWFESQLNSLPQAIRGQVEYLGSPATREEKFQILRSFDVLCVPTDYHEPKGLYVLEAGLVGVPALLPNHGAFPELVSRLDTGLLFDPSHSDGLANELRRVLSDDVPSFPDLPNRVRDAFGMQATGPLIMDAIESFRED